MASILSFDNRSMSFLLDDQFKEYFSDEFPIIFKNKVQKGNPKEEKYFYRNPIDIALKFDQVRAVQQIVEYVVKHQNNFVSSYLFNKNLPSIIKMGVSLTNLLNSKIFVKDSVLIITMNSAPLKHELNNSKSKVLAFLKRNLERIVFY